MNLKNIVKNYKKNYKITKEKIADKSRNIIHTSLILITLETGLMWVSGCYFDKPYESKKTTLEGKIVSIKYNSQFIGNKLTSKADVIMESDGKYYHFSAEGNGLKGNPGRAEVYNYIFQKRDSTRVEGKLGKKESDYLKDKGIKGKDIYWQKAWEIKDHKNM